MCSCCLGDLKNETMGEFSSIKEFREVALNYGYPPKDITKAISLITDRRHRAVYKIIEILNSQIHEEPCKNDSIDLSEYLSTYCFKGYGDDENGFYSVYRRVFEDIARVEGINAPSFGSSDNGYHFELFYSYWMNYTTKSCDRLYKHKPTLVKFLLGRFENHGLQERAKAMNYENLMVRAEAQKKCTEQVRALVAFIRKRDKRVIALMKKIEGSKLKNKQRCVEMRKESRITRDKHEKRAKRENIDSEAIEEKSTIELYESLYEEVDHSLSIPEQFYCIACKKVLKSQKSFENHELSKKHKQKCTVC